MAKLEAATWEEPDPRRLHELRRHSYSLPAAAPMSGMPLLNAPVATWEEPDPFLLQMLRDRVDSLPAAE